MAGYIIAAVVYIISIKSFGVPFLSSMVPHYPSSKDLFLRPPVWKQWIRPQNNNPKNRVRQSKP